MRDGTVAEDGSEYASRALPMNKQFAVRSCTDHAGGVLERLAYQFSRRKFRT